MKPFSDILKLATIGTFLFVAAGLQGNNMKYELVPLDYDYDALEPHIDEETVRLHHDKHQATYVKKLNDAIESESNFKAPEDLKVLLSDLNAVPESIRKAVRNNGGGAWNHTFYWKGFAPQKTQPSETLSKAINDSFGSFDNFKKELSDACINQFGSGWGWLTIDKSGKLHIETTSNQDAPFMGAVANASGNEPLLAIDVWEHAYYLKYQNVRADYVKAIWNIINWDEVSDRYQKAVSGRK